MKNVAAPLPYSSNRLITAIEAAYAALCSAPVFNYQVHTAQLVLKWSYSLEQRVGVNTSYEGNAHYIYLKDWKRVRR